MGRLALAALVGMSNTLLAEGPDFGARRAAKLYQVARPFLRRVWAEPRPLPRLKASVRTVGLLRTAVHAALALVSNRCGKQLMGRFIAPSLKPTDLGVQRCASFLRPHPTAGDSTVIAACVGDVHAPTCMRIEGALWQLCPQAHTHIHTHPPNAGVAVNLLLVHAAPGWAGCAVGAQGGGGGADAGAVGARGQGH